MERLAEEAAEHAAACHPLRSVFVGGGTPTALSAREIDRLGRLVQQHFTLAQDCEFTFEANPDSLTPAKIDAMMAAGMNRLSLGIQSFLPRMRKILGRRTTLARLPAILDILHRNGLNNINFDLIFAIPGQKLDDWQADLQAAIALQPSHLSAYALMIEPGTPLARRMTKPVDERRFLECWHRTDSALRPAGLRRYEISNFAKHGQRCRYNWEIWHGQTYLGLGPAAVSFDGVNRPANPPSLQDWLDHAPQADDIIPARKRQAEILAFGLRTLDGWLLDDYRRLTGLDPLQAFAPAIRRLCEHKLLKATGDSLRPTARGLLLNDCILEEILAEGNPKTA